MKTGKGWREGWGRLICHSWRSKAFKSSPPSSDGSGSVWGARGWGAVGGRGGRIKKSVKLKKHTPSASKELAKHKKLFVLSLIRARTKGKHQKKTRIL